MSKVSYIGGAIANKYAVMRSRQDERTVTSQSLETGIRLASAHAKEDWVQSSMLKQM